MKRLKASVVVALFCCASAYAQSPVQVVKGFGDALSEWCETDDINIRLEKLDTVNGKISCRVTDEVAKLMLKKDPRNLQSNFDLSVYLDGFRDAIVSSKGQKFQMSNVQARPDFVEPTAEPKFSKDVEPKYYVSADLSLKGYFSCDMRDLYFVRGKHITKIIDYSSDESLGTAIELYSNGKYDEAFKIFRKLAYADFTNFDAQYYTAVMELKKQGCGYMDKAFRDQELAWFVLKNYYAANEDATRLMLRFNFDYDKLDYAKMANNNAEWYIRLMRFSQPGNSDRMMSYNSKRRKCGFIDEYGKLVIGYKYKLALPFHEGLALVMNDAGKVGFIDKDGEEVVPIIYKDALRDFHNGRNFCFTEDDNVVLIDKAGKVLKSIGSYKNYHVNNPIGKYAALYKSNNIFDVYDYDGNMIASDCDSWTADGKTGIITVKKEKSTIVEYKIE